MFEEEKEHIRLDPDEAHLAHLDRSPHPYPVISTEAQSAKWRDPRFVAAHTFVALRGTGLSTTGGPVRYGRDDDLRGQYYWGGSPVAYYTSSTHFQTQDWLGTARVQADAFGAVDGAYPSLPFGEDLAGDNGSSTYGNGSANQNAYHYAQLDHDFETNTDHATFRQYSPVQGRWMSPDPYDGSYDFSNPQSFNRYAYVLNNPLSMTDPLGLRICDGSPADTDGPCTSGGGFLGLILNGLEALFGLGKPPFHGSLRPRPTIPTQLTYSSQILQENGMSVLHVNTLLLTNQEVAYSASSLPLRVLGSALPVAPPFALHYLTGPRVVPRPSFAACVFAPDAVNDIHNLQKGIFKRAC